MPKKKPTRPSGDYAVGKGRPPKHTQFAKGQSGNPGGKMRGPNGLRDLLKLVAESAIEIKKDGRPVKVSLLHALLLRHAEAALKGNARAMEDLLDRIERLLDGGREQKLEMPDEDRILLERARRSRGSTPKPEPDVDDVGSSADGPRDDHDDEDGSDAD